MEPLPPAFRRALRARAHHLHPVVSIGHQGLTPAVLHEIDVALSGHELIKVRVFGDDRREREALLASICAALDCGAVQQIGKLLVLWRPRSDSAPPGAPVATARRAAIRTNQRPSADAGARRRRSDSAGKPVARGVTAVASRRSGGSPAKSWSPAPPTGARRGSSSIAPPSSSPALRTQRNRAGAAHTSGTTPPRHRPGKAPAGVPRAAAPRRRRIG